MKVARLKHKIRALPDTEVKPLIDWLKEYYDGEVWDREMDQDIAELGAEEWERRLTAGAENASPRRQAALRLMNTMRFKSTTERDLCLKDFECVLGESLV